MPGTTGIVPFWKQYDRKAVLRFAQLAEDLGYDSIWIPEAWGYEQFQLLAEIACVTRRLKLGTGITNVFSRSPGLLAMSAAVLTVFTLAAVFSDLPRVFNTSYSGPDLRWAVHLAVLFSAANLPLQLSRVQLRRRRPFACTAPVSYGAPAATARSTRVLRAQRLG